jgi:outer membrane protein assembly factor BamD (BamD/ComL family)
VIQDFTVVPVTTYSWDRAFSKLSHVKSKLHSTMMQDRLQNLMLLYVEYDLAASVNVEDIIDEFKTMVPFERWFVL